MWLVISIQNLVTTKLFVIDYDYFKADIFSLSDKFYLKFNSKFLSYFKLSSLITNPKLTDNALCHIFF